jgi:tetratricopeptide (TPR) repeat protein
LRADGDLPAARGLLEQAIDHQQQGLVPKSPEANATSDDARAWQFLANQYQNLVSTLVLLKDFDAADRLVQRQLSLAREQTEKLGPTKITREFQARAWVNQAQLEFAREKLDLAAESYRRAAQVRRDLAAESPNSPQSAHELGIVLGTSADIPLKRSQWNEAAAILEEALTHHEQALAAEPINRDFRRFLHNDCVRLSQASFQLGDHQRIAVLAGVRERTGDSYREYFWAGRLAQCVRLAEDDSSLDDERRQELAASYGDLAIELLQEARRKKVPEFSRLATDAAFKPLHSREDFQRLLP